MLFTDPAGQTQIVGVSDPTHIKIEGQPGALIFGKLKLPTAMWFMNFPTLGQPTTAPDDQTNTRVDTAKCLRLRRMRPGLPRGSHYGCQSRTI